MSIQLLTSRDLLESPRSLDGKRFVISGLLIVKEKSAWVELDNDDSLGRLQVENDDLVERLLDSVPCYLGGEYLYRDRARLTCVLEADKDGAVHISRVESGEVTRDGAAFSF